MSKKKQQHQPTVITFGIRKGGPGKTTMVSNVAGALLETGARVLLVDFDHQGNLTSQYGTNGAGTDGLDIGRGVIDDIPLDHLVHETRFENLWIIPAEEFALQEAQAAFYKDEQRLLYLRDGLPLLYDAFDYVLIDTGLWIGFAIRAALAASTGYVLVVNPDTYSFEGVRTTQAEAQAVRAYNPRLKFLGCIVNKVRQNKDDAAFIEEFRRDLGDKLLSTHIPYSAAYNRANTQSRPVTHLEVTSRSKKKQTSQPTRFKPSRSRAAGIIRDLLNELHI